MAEAPDVVAALLYVATNTDPFNGSHALYGAVKLKRGYPLGEMETPTVALYEFGGTGMPRGLGTIKQNREAVGRVDVLAETSMDGARIVEKLRNVWQADYDCDGSGAVGDVGNGYMRETGGVKDLLFSEPAPLEWDSNLDVKRLVFDVTVKFRD